MIQAHELRIGNCVSFIAMGGELMEGTVATISENEVLVMLDPHYPLVICPPKFILPIAITEDRLVMLNFEKNTRSNLVKEFTNEAGNVKSLIVFPPQNIWFDKSKPYPDFFGTGVQDSLLDSVALRSVKYLHEIQNLYYAVAGEELLTSASLH